jgi:DNA-binding PadR family transcriptional regulator
MARLLILWLLAEQPLHGYRIKRILEDEAYAFWFAIEFTSIYSALRTLVKQGHVEETGSDQQGARPERMGYRITADGRAHLRDLLCKAWAATPVFGDPFQMAIAATAELPADEVGELRKQRQAALTLRLKHCRALRRAALSPAMVDRGSALIAAEIKWLKSW